MDKNGAIVVGEMINVSSLSGFVCRYVIFGAFLCCARLMSILVPQLSRFGPWETLPIGST